MKQIAKGFCISQEDLDFDVDQDPVQVKLIEAVFPIVDLLRHDNKVCVGTAILALALEERTDRETSMKFCYSIGPFLKLFLEQYDKEKSNDE